MRTLIPLAFALALALGPLPTAQTSLDAELVATGFTHAFQVAQPPGDASRLYVLQQRGRVQLVKDGVIQPVDFVDLSAKVSQSGNSRGLLSFAFHPDFATNGHVYFLYTSEFSGHATVVERYTTVAGDPEQLDPSTGTLILGPVAQPSSVHNGGKIWFGFDGKLYVPLGDGGPAGTNSNCSGQDGSTLLGKVLRLNDDGSIPVDNPFVGDPTVLDEVWQTGVRNPWRPTIDALTGDLYLEDVGFNTREELNVVNFGAQAGRNFGWKQMEGGTCGDTTGCPPTIPPCGDGALTTPVHDYSHVGGRCAIIGGVVYRGADLPDFQGRYFYTDWCTTEMLSLRWDGAAVQDLQDHTADLAPEITSAVKVTSFAEGADGEVYVVHRFGDVFRLVSGDPSLTADVGSVSLSAGGVQTLSLRTWDDAHALDLYLVLSSGSGTSPGLPLAPGVVLPLNVLDPYFDFSLAFANQPPFGNTLSFLDATSQATATLTVPPGSPGGLAGTLLNHAYLVFDVSEGFAISFASDPVSLTLTP